MPMRVRTSHLRLVADLDGFRPRGLAAGEGDAALAAGLRPLGAGDLDTTAFAGEGEAAFLAGRPRGLGLLPADVKIRVRRVCARGVAANNREKEGLPFSKHDESDESSHTYPQQPQKVLPLRPPHTSSLRWAQLHDGGGWVGEGVYLARSFSAVGLQTAAVTHPAPAPTPGTVRWPTRHRTEQMPASHTARPARSKRDVGRRTVRATGCLKTGQVTHGLPRKADDEVDGLLDLRHII